MIIVELHYNGLSVLDHGFNVFINGVNSECKYIENCVMVRSIWRPILCLIYINNVPNSTSSFILCFILTTQSCYAKVEKVITWSKIKKVQHVICILHINDFHLIATKSICSALHTSERLMEIDNTNVNQSSRTNFLGIIKIKSLA